MHLPSGLCILLPGLGAWSVNTWVAGTDVAYNPVALGCHVRGLHA